MREFITKSASFLGITLDWVGEGIHEQAIVKDCQKRQYPGIKIGQSIIKVDARYFRPTEVDTLLGDCTKAKKQLGWEPSIPFLEGLQSTYASYLKHNR